MSYDEVKTHEGKLYTGMRVGSRHSWLYPDGHWLERKKRPDEWEIRFHCTKRRRQQAPEGSGAPLGSMFHWFVVAHQRVRKVGADEYQTLMEGLKFKVAHQRADALRWSSQYRGASTARQATIAAIERVLRGLREQEQRRAAGLERTLSALPEWRPAGQTRLPREEAGGTVEVVRS